MVIMQRRRTIGEERSGASCWLRKQLRQSKQIERRTRQDKQRIHVRQPAQFDYADPGDVLQPAERGLDPRPRMLTLAIARVSGRRARQSRCHQHAEALSTITRSRHSRRTETMNRSTEALPRRARRGANFLNAHGLRRRGRRVKGKIAVVNEIARRLILPKRFAELQRGPGCRRISRDGDMGDSTALACEENISADRHRVQMAARASGGSR
jgi:hypothetical protein